MHSQPPPFDTLLLNLLCTILGFEMEQLFRLGCQASKHQWSCHHTSSFFERE